MAYVTDRSAASSVSTSGLGQAAALCAAIAIARVIALQANSTELHFDESQYWAWSRELAFGYYSKPPLIAWIIAGSTQVCGDSEFCVRLPSVMMHAATGIVIYMLAATLYTERIGFWSAAAYATLPGVAVSSGIISTDVPLLLCCAVALLAFVRLLRKPSWPDAFLLGASLGLGLNAKYAMAYFVLCAGIYFIFARGQRVVLRRPHLWVALMIAAVIITPNLIWNSEHEFATFTHTADNAKWTLQALHLGKALEFLVMQFGVVGPILFGTLLAISWQSLRAHAAQGPRLPDAGRLLLAFSLPIIIAVTVQAFLSRAHANWAVAAYPAATILVIAHLLRPEARSWLRASFVMNTSVSLAVAVGAAYAGNINVPGLGNPFGGMLGNRALAISVQEILSNARRDGDPYAAVLSDERELVASLIYYGRGDATPVMAWRADGVPRDHFQLTRGYAATQSQPVLFVTRQTHPTAVTKAFSDVEPIEKMRPETGQTAALKPYGRSPRVIQFFKLREYRGQS